jgi:2-(1,2-epoxy-1,2-dihydrophenyl)acetyl-CoA isomerase
MAGVLHDAIKQIRYIDAVVIAVLDGVAVGAGLSLAAACDLVVATPKTVLNMGYRRIGLTTDGGGSFFLPRLIGVQRLTNVISFPGILKWGRRKSGAL